MFRETLQTLACLSVLAGTYSLHMARDSYRRPLDDLDVLDITDNTPQLLKQHNQQKIEQQQENDISIGHINLHHSEPPRELQELFSGSSPLDIRLQQQQQQQNSQQSQQQSQQHQNQNKRGSTGNSGGGGAVGNSVSTSSGTQNLPTVPHGMASQLMLRSARGQRQYDVPQIGKFTRNINNLL